MIKKERHRLMHADIIILYQPLLQYYLYHKSRADKVKKKNETWLVRKLHDLVRGKSDKI